MTRTFEAGSICVWCGEDTALDVVRTPVLVDFDSSFLSAEVDAKFFDLINGYGCSTCLQEIADPS